ncbi:MAG: hypothetical protein C0399_06945 [Syntrophus sp. (in: bacteria)]|nr:hypothetical protein [Syntrophus sp. (in: bacteria)]
MKMVNVENTATRNVHKTCRHGNQEKPHRHIANCMIIAYNHTMKVEDCCLSCLKGLAEKTVYLSGGDEVLLHECCILIEKLWGPETTPPGISNTLLRYIKEKTGNHDPYGMAKEKEFTEAIKAFQEVRGRSSNSLEGSIRLSAMGNSMDFFIDGHYNHDNFIFTGDVDKIKDLIYIKGKDVLMIGDNIGDLIFDMPLVEHLKKKGKRVYYAVREEPVQNDLSMKDVDRFGLKNIYSHIISTGTDEVGLKKEDLKGMVRELWESNAVVIAKGMGNFETISAFHSERPVVYVMKVKCPAVAHAVEQSVGTYIALSGGE